VHFGFDLAQPERRYCDASNAAGAIHSQTDVASGGRGAQEDWIRRDVWHAGPENGWLCCGYGGAHVMRWRWEHRSAGIAITLSKPTAYADGVPTDPHKVG